MRRYERDKHQLYVCVQVVSAPVPRPELLLAAGRLPAQLDPWPGVPARLRHLLAASRVYIMQDTYQLSTKQGHALML